MSSLQRYRTPPGQAGYAAFHLAIPLADCNHPGDSPERTEWELGWTRAEAGWADWTTETIGE